jgi:hypothetical protein
MVSNRRIQNTLHPQTLSENNILILPLIQYIPSTPSSTSNTIITMNLSTTSFVLCILLLSILLPSFRISLLLPLDFLETEELLSTYYISL